MSVIETAPVFDLPGVDGRNHALAEYADAPVLVLVQSCNHCPYVLAWEGRIDALQREYAGRGVRIVAVNSNDVDASPRRLVREMVEHARDAGYSFDYLYDESQELARILGAERTPEAFVFDATAARLPRRRRRRPRRGRRGLPLPSRRDRGRSGRRVAVRSTTRHRSVHRQVA